MQGAENGEGSVVKTSLTDKRIAETAAESLLYADDDAVGTPVGVDSKKSIVQSLARVGPSA